MSAPPDPPPPPTGDAPATSTPVVVAPGTEKAAAAEEQRSPRRTVPVRLAVAIGVIMVVVLVMFLMWLDARRSHQALRLDVAERLAGVESAISDNGKAQAQLANDLREAQAKIAVLEARQREAQADQAALEALYRDLAPSRDEIALSEIEQVLLVASQQLQLAGNVPSALTALQVADTKLQRLDRPQFVPLRSALSRDIDRLKAVPFVDLVGMTLKLDQAISAIDTLPLAMDERVPPNATEKAAMPADDSRWRQFWREIWNDAKQLVRIEVADRPAAPLVPMAQQYYLRENLKLRLLSARIALLSRNDASFQSDLAAADAWLTQYFDLRAKAVQSIHSAVKQLAASPMPGEVPDLNRSLEALRVLRLAQERAPSREPARAPFAR